MKDTLKCRSAWCTHESKDIPRSEAVKEGGAYYHSDCLQAKKDAAEIRDLYIKNIDNAVILSHLNGVLKNIIVTKKVNSEKLLFCFKFYLENGIPLHKPYGLHYVIQNRDACMAYEKQLLKKFENIKVDITEESGTEFEYKPIRKKNIIDVLGG